MSGETTERDDDRQLAAEYALGLLDEAGQRAFEARLAAEPALRAEYALWAEEFATLAADGAGEEPPARLLGAIEADLFGGVPEARARARGWRWAGLGGLLAAAAAMLFLWLGPADLWQGGAPDLRARLEAEQPGTFLIAAGYDRESGILEIDRRAGAPAPGRSFELWLIAGDDAPVSLGVLPEVERGIVVVSEALRPRMEGGTLAVSDEPEGGSPTGAPTGAVIAAAPLITAS